MDAFKGADAAKKYSENALMCPENVQKAVISLMSLNYGRSHDEEYVFDRMIDIGCGGGHSTVQFCKFFKSIIGIDLSEEQIKMAEKLNARDNITYKIGTANEMEVEDNSVDLITSASAAHYFDMIKFPQECKRVLKPGGCVVIYGYYYKDFLMVSPTKVDDKKSSGIELFESLVYGPYHQFLKDTNHPAQEFLNGYRNMSQNFTGFTEHSMSDLSFNKTFTLASFNAWFKTTPSVKIFIESSDSDPLDNFCASVKHLWSFPDVEDDDIHMEVCFRVVMLMLKKET